MDSPTVPEILLAGPVLQATAHLAQDRHEDRQRQTLASLTVGAGIGGNPPLGQARLLGQHVSDRFPAGAVGVQNLNQKGPEGDYRIPDPVSPGVAFRRRQDILHPQTLRQLRKMARPTTLEQLSVICYPCHPWPPFCLR